jgi:hypothetical protein
VIFLKILATSLEVRESVAEPKKNPPMRSSMNAALVSVLKSVVLASASKVLSSGANGVGAFAPITVPARVMGVPALPE